MDSPIVCSAALGVFEAIEEDDLLENTIKMGEYIKTKIMELKKEQPIISGIKGLGLMIGVNLDIDDASEIALKCVDEGLLINCTQKNILRIMPPMTINEKDVDSAISILKKVKSLRK